jgi:imidazolonepropionase
VREAYSAARVVTCDPARATPDNPLGAIEDGAVVVEAGRVAWVGPQHRLPEDVSLVDHPLSVLTPGLVDAHTHSCWTGSRHSEYAARMAGRDYETIARGGGGILSTYRSVAAASATELAIELTERLRRMAALGVTCVEVKSGYGLEPQHEEKQLQAIAEVANDPSLPAVVATFLALHALPPSAIQDRSAYVDRVAREVVPRFAAARLSEFVDAYVDPGAFRVEDARAVGRAARAAGLSVRLHVGQFADVGGAQLCGELGAASADHLEHVSDAGIAQLAEAGTSAILLPIASFTLGHAPPPVARLRAAGVPLVVASDANPGTAPTESLPLALALAVRTYGLSPEEALLGATRVAAASLHRFGNGAREVRGALVVGACADLVIWDLPHELALVQPWGVSRTRLVVRDGRVLHSATTHVGQQDPRGPGKGRSAR